MPAPRTAKTVVERLSGDLLRDLRDDVRLLRDTDTEVLFAVDAFDVLRYCFPLRPFDRSFAIDVAAQADYHAALSYVLTYRRWRPILLAEYMVELHGFAAAALERGGTRASVDAALRSELSGVLEGSVAHEADDDTLKFLRENFSAIMLLMANAAKRVGFQELGRLVGTRLSPLSNFAPNDESAAAVHRALHEFAASYQPNREFVEYCERTLEQAYESVNEPHGRGARAQAASNRADAVALDRITQLNAQLADAHRRGVLPRPYRVLLLSSASRMRRLMRMFDRVATPQASLEDVAAQRVVRVPDQVFAYIVSQPVKPEGGGRGWTAAAGGATETVVQTIEWLVQLEEETHDLRSKTQHVGSCGQCVLHGHPNTRCEWRDMCERLALLEAHRREILTPYQNSSENLALLAAFGEYVREPSQYRGSQSTMIRSILRMLSDEHVIAQTRAALADVREILLTRTILAHAWCKLGRGEAAEVSASTTRDYIRGAHHAMPWVLALHTPELRTVLDLARHAFFEHPDDTVARREHLTEAFGQLIQFDTGQERSPQEQFEGDLVRVVLFLALSDDDSAQAAIVHSAGLTRERAGEEHADALYVASWAHRRAGLFKESVDYATAGVEQFEYDPRMWYARALAKYSQLRAGGQPASPFAMPSIVADLQEALRRFREGDAKPDEASLVAMAGCLNALAYLVAMDRTSVDRVARAREMLSELKAVLPQSEWVPSFPEFFHTEATVELEEAEALRADARRAKLEHARAAAIRARDLATSRSDYGQFVASIEEKIASTVLAPARQAPAV